MSQLNLWSRPWIVFDPANKQHRRWFTEFQRTRTWGHCPVRFVLDEPEGELITQIQNQLITYYINREFRESKTNKTQPQSRKKYVSKKRIS